MTQARRSPKALGWISLVLFAGAVVVLLVPVVRFVLATSDDGVPLSGESTEVHAPGGRTWGIYLDDADNSGYSESCALTDANGAAIEIRGPGVTLSSSDTEMLDHVFTTPDDGVFTVECQVSSATARVGPVGDIRSVLLGAGIALALGLGGLLTGVVWLTRGRAVPTAPTLQA